LPLLRKEKGQRSVADTIPDQNILLLDIEWRPTKAYVWRAWDENIAPAQVIENGGLLCVGVKWLGDKKTVVYSEWEHGHEQMLHEVHEMMSYADAIITFNGDRYDLPKLQGEFVLNGFPPPPPCTSIDVYKTTKKFGFFMGKLAFIGPLLGVGSKLEHEGFGLWKKVDEGDTKAQARMSKYCAQDVDLLEKLYLKIRPFVKTHPHLGQVGGHQCGACGSVHVQSRGTRRTRAFKIQRLQCQDCGSWQDGTRKKV
jgi:hypothetical protein